MVIADAPLDAAQQRGAEAAKGYEEGLRTVVTRNGLEITADLVFWCTGSRSAHPSSTLLQCAVLLEERKKRKQKQKQKFVI